MELGWMVQEPAAGSWGHNFPLVNRKPRSSHPAGVCFMNDTQNCVYMEECRSRDPAPGHYRLTAGRVIGYDTECGSLIWQYAKKTNGQLVLFWFWSVAGLCVGVFRVGRRDGQHRGTGSRSGCLRRRREGFTRTRTTANPHGRTVDRACVEQSPEGSRIRLPVVKADSSGD